MRRFIVGTLVAAGLFLTRMVLLALGVLLQRMGGGAGVNPTAPKSANGHRRSRASA